MNRALCFVLIFTVLHLTETRASHGVQHARALLKSLANEEWSDDEEHCKAATFRLLNAMKNHTTWATWVWDSMQPPMSALYGTRYHLGSFDQCLSDPWLQESMQYCLVDVRLESTREYEEVDPLGSVKEFVGVESKHGHRQLNHYSLGICLPSGCSTSSVAKVSRHLHQMTHIPFGNVTVEPRNCQRKETKMEFSLGFYVFWFIIFLSAGTTVTVYLFGDLVKITKLSTAASWFHPARNFNALTAMDRNELATLNGLRSFCMGAAIVMHYFYYEASYVTNAGDIEKDMETTVGKIFVEFALIIDTFFLISGLLQATGLLLNSENSAKMLLKRYLKLVIPFALSVLFMRSVLRHTGSGPLWPLMLQEQVDPCTENSLPGLLMVNNFIKTKKICHIVSWYISCDYQLTLLGTMIFCLCMKAERRRVLMICSAVFLVASTLPVIVGYWYALPPILIYDYKSSISSVSNKVFHKTYIKPYSRAVPYLIGMLLGYAMHVYKPVDHKKKISTPWSILCGTLALITMFLIMFVGGYISQLPYNAVIIGAYTAVHRIIYAMGLCLLIIVCEYGTFPIIGDFFTSKVFTPISRLGYGMYLYHPALIFANNYSTRTLYTYNFVNWIINAMGYVVLSCVISYLHWFIIDAPWNQCINYLLKNTNGASKAVSPKDEKSDQKANKQF